MRRRRSGGWKRTAASEHYGMTEGGGRASRLAGWLTVWIRASFAVLCL
jgi:hypothetical protein